MWTHGRARVGAKVGRYSTSSLTFVWFRATAEVPGAVIPVQGWCTIGVTWYRGSYLGARYPNHATGVLGVGCVGVG